MVVGGVALIAAAAASYADPPAMTFIGIAALIVLAVGAVTLIRRPRLVLTTGPTLIVKTLRGPMELTPDDIERVSILKTRRLAARGRQLVIDLPDDRLLIFGRWDLGVDPTVVAGELRTAGFRVDD
nr:PH domain-containing protein [Gordonia humi]